MSCIFCDIVNRKIPCYKVAENKNAIAFLDINPLSDGHTIIISKQHYPDWQSTPLNVLNDIVALSKIVTNKIDKTLKPWGYNYLSNQGKIAGQVILHIHLHIIPKYFANQGFSFSSKKIDTISVEKLAKKLKCK